MGDRRGLTAIALSDGLEQHLFRFRIGLEGLISFECQYGYRRAFRQVAIDLDATINDLA